jgi:hypothetical protein
MKLDNRVLIIGSGLIIGSLASGVGVVVVVELSWVVEADVVGNARESEGLVIGERILDELV